MKNAVIIFVRNPELGKVKTRLAREIGHQKALQVYIELLQHTHDATCKMKCDKFVYYEDGVTENDLWENDLFEKRLQEGKRLGDRMMRAFLDLFQQGYSKVVIIGSDCPELTTSIIEEAFERLELKDVAIGPTYDGGYYLLGLRQLIPELFVNKQWSTDTVFTHTIKNIISLKMEYGLLSKLSDIDTAEDLNCYRQIIKT